MFTQGHRVTGKLEHSVIKLHEAIKMFVMVDYATNMTVKKSWKYGEVLIVRAFAPPVIFVAHPVLD